MPRSYVRDISTYLPVTIAEPIEESRQHYATVRIQELQRAWARVNRTLPFPELLHAFRYYGMVYDQGI